MHSPISKRGSVRLLIVLSSILLGAVTMTYAQTATNLAGKVTKTAGVTAKPQVKGAYFGETWPGETPVRFAPEVLNSVSAWVEAIAFSPDGTQVVLSVGAADYSSGKLYYSECVNGVWTPFAEAPFISDFTYSNEPVFSRDGTTLMFTGRKAAGTKDLWTVRYTGKAWSIPVPLPSPINSDAEEYRGSTMSDGTMYFGRNRSGMMQVYKGYKDAAQKLVVEPVGAPVNTQSYEGDPCIAPDGQFLIFYSARDRRSSDLYVSFEDEKGGWGAPINLGPKFNSSDDEYGAHLSSDGKYLFFTRHSAQRNGIYWVATSAIEKLKP
jgi:Tol biopolymer transport system component